LLNLVGTMSSPMVTVTNAFVANFSAFEIEDEVLPNLREYALANSLYWVCIVF